MKAGFVSVANRLVLGLFIATAVVFLSGFVYVRGLFGAAGGEDYTLKVEQGETVAAVSRELKEHKIIKNDRILRYLLDKNGTASKLKEGSYDLTGKMSAQQVADVLAGPARIPVINVTIPEGKRIKDLPDIFSKAGFDSGAILEALKDTSSSRYAAGQSNLEGFIFPATYEFKPKENAKEIVKKMQMRMEEEFTAENIAKAKQLNLSVRDWVILASMVQAEAANNAEMPVIAGIFINRLRQGIPLGSDPTVAYGLGKDLPELDRSAGDFTKDTPYSTYTRKGLPVGAINNPGQAALLSVLNPQLKLADGRDAVYFLHAKDGSIHVNHTYQEHLRDIDLYR